MHICCDDMVMAIRRELVPVTGWRDMKGKVYPFDAPPSTRVRPSTVSWQWQRILKCTSCGRSYK
jgi:hypothetical protein